MIDAVYEQPGVIIYGLGNIGKIISDRLSELFYDTKHGKTVVYSVTDRDNLKSTFCDKAMVFSIHNAVERYPYYPIIIATVDNRNTSMKNICEHLPSVSYTVSIKFYAEQLTQIRLDRILEKVEINEKLERQIVKKISMPDDIWTNGNVHFYVPNYPSDFIQRTIVENQDFFEADLLKKLDEYIPSSAIILDIGANIGNHSLYWAKKRMAQKIYSFEPMLSTYQTLLKNIQINHLDDIIIPLNIGLSDTESCAELNTYIISNPELKFSIDYIGSASLSKSDNGEMKLNALDQLLFISDLERIDFVKIDVEGFEHNVLKGAEITLKKYKPIVFIESFPDNFAETNKILNSYGYSMIMQLDEINYLYK